MALVAAGRADGTWTLVPKSEWDVAAGVALVSAAGGVVARADASAPTFNALHPKVPNLVAVGAGLAKEVLGGFIESQDAVRAGP